MILILTLSLGYAKAQTIGELIGHGTKFEKYGEPVIGNYKIMLETEILNAIIVEEVTDRNWLFHFSILTSTKRSENMASITYDINADSKGDKYYLALTISKKAKNCLLLIFDGTKREWYPSKVAVRSYGFNY